MTKRSIQLALTRRMVLSLLRMAKTARRKAERQHALSAARGWKPEPGSYDVNLSIIEQMDDVIKQLRAGLNGAEEKPREKTT